MGPAAAPGSLHPALRPVAAMAGLPEEPQERARTAELVFTSVLALAAPQPFRVFAFV